MTIKIGDYEVRFATTPEERRQVRQLRYKVFCEEEGAKPTKKQKELQEEYDKFDTYAAYLAVFHKNKIVGTYRIIDRKAAEKMGGFYTESEFDISKIKNSNFRIAEMSRACVAYEYRQKNIPLRLLWIGLNQYIEDNKIDILFGMASWKGTNPLISSNAISYLYHNHLSPLKLRATVNTDKLPKDIDPKLVKMGILQKNLVDFDTARKEMPPLIKGYLDLNATFGDGVFIDKRFNSYEIFVVLQTHDINPAYKKFFSQRLGR